MARKWHCHVLKISVEITVRINTRVWEKVLTGRDFSGHIVGSIVSCCCLDAHPSTWYQPPIALKDLLKRIVM
jgi:hypothetical protein